MTIRKAVNLLLPSFITILGAVGIMLITRSKPVRAVPVEPEMHSEEFQKAFFLASRIYGKAGCGDQKLAEMTARHAIESGLPAQIVAAQVASESNCNPEAISNRGAVGLMQVVPKTWGKTFDFTKVNLFNPDESMTVGTKILSDSVKKYGSIRAGLVHYYGTGTDDIGLGGAGYAEHVLGLAGKL